MIVGYVCRHSVGIIYDDFKETREAFVIELNMNHHDDNDELFKHILEANNYVSFVSESGIKEHIVFR